MAGQNIARQESQAIWGKGEGRERETEREGRVRKIPAIVREASCDVTSNRPDQTGQIVHN